MSLQTHYLMRVRTKFNRKIDKLLLENHVITMYNDIRVHVFKYVLQVYARASKAHLHNQHDRGFQPSATEGNKFKIGVSY